MKNIRFGLCIPAFLFALFCTQQASPQGYVKLNVPYALVGVVNPAVEFAISPKSTLQTDIVISPWKSINEKHMKKNSTAAISRSITGAGIWGQTSA